MEPFNWNLTSSVGGSSNQQGESESQNSPPTQFPNFPQYYPPNFLQNFHPFGLPNNYPPYSHPQMFQGPQNQGNWRQTTAASFQGVQIQENPVHSPNQVFRFAANRSQGGM
jgi:hypothetical protein